MKTVLKSSHNEEVRFDSGQHARSTLVIPPNIYNIRPCPQCGEPIFGMPGGRDAHCHLCGYKDPCCSD